MNDYETDIDTLYKRELLVGAGEQCDYCREVTGDCRPCAVVGRRYVPALCDDCYTQLGKADRIDCRRDREIFHP